MSTDPTSRALRLLSLLSSRPRWSGPELGAQLGVTDRTLRRDIDRLRSLGHRVDGTAGPSGGYRLVAGADLPPLFLDDDEAVAIAAALITATGEGATGMVDSSTRALAKLNHVLPAPLFRRIAAVHAATSTIRTADAPEVDPEAVATLAEAARDRRQVRFRYQDRQGRATERRVDPHSLVTPGRVWYLVGYDLDRRDWRVFRVDRTQQVVGTGHGAEVREVPGGSAAALVARAIARTPMAHAAIVHVPASAADLAGAHPGLLRARIHTVDDDRCTASLGAGTLDGLVRLVLEVLQAVPGGRVEAAPAVEVALAEAADRLQRALLPLGDQRR